MIFATKKNKENLEELKKRLESAIKENEKKNSECYAQAIITKKVLDRANGNGKRVLEEKNA